MADLCSQVEVLWRATTGVTTCVKLLTLVRELHWDALDEPPF